MWKELWIGFYDNVVDGKIGISGNSGFCGRAKRETGVKTTEVI